MKHVDISVVLLSAFSILVFLGASLDARTMYAHDDCSAGSTCSPTSETLRIIKRAFNHIVTYTSSCFAHESSKRIERRRVNRGFRSAGLIVGLRSWLHSLFSRMQTVVTRPETDGATVRSARRPVTDKVVETVGQVAARPDKGRLQTLLVGGARKEVGG